MDTGEVIVEGNQAGRAVEATRCIVCGRVTSVALCSMDCRAAARTESERNQARIERLRGHGFEACLDEVQAVVRRNLQLVRALDDPSLAVSAG